VVIDNAAADERFLMDPYVQRTRLASVLCAPIANQGKLAGVLYLENSVARGAFSRRRVELVQLMAGQAAVAIENARLYKDLDDRVKERTRELQASNEELMHTLSRLRETQRQLVVHEKLASLGQLTAGIAHEIKNPLNFVVNFAALSIDLTDELAGELERLPSAGPGEVTGLVRDLRELATKTQEHGLRANGIVKAMLEHSRAGTGAGERREVDVNTLLREYIKLAVPENGDPEKHPRVVIQAHYDEDMRPIALVPNDVGRVFLNVVNNAAYAVRARRRAMGEPFTPTIRVSTRDLDERVDIRVRDNGGGMPPEVHEKAFLPFFTTKPAGEGTGLGLSISREIIVEGNGGTIEIETREGDFTEVVITLPRRREGG
jgi:signal transduction histidine kinase